MATHEVAVCPYCGAASAAVDVDRPALVLPPGGPCRHAAFLSVGLDALGRGGRRDVGRTGHWLWARGAGLRDVPLGRPDPVVDLVDRLACGLAAEDERPGVEYRAGGATAGEREAACPGSGEVRLRAAGGRRLVGVFDGHALYSPDPAALVADVRRLAGVG